MRHDDARTPWWCSVFFFIVLRIQPLAIACDIATIERNDNYDASVTHLASRKMDIGGTKLRRVSAVNALNGAQRQALNKTRVYRCSFTDILCKFDIQN